jgi:hypothetical protein
MSMTQAWVPGKLFWGWARARPRQNGSISFLKKETKNFVL